MPWGQHIVAARFTDIHVQKCSFYLRLIDALKIKTKWCVCCAVLLMNSYNAWVVFKVLRC